MKFKKYILFILIVAIFLPISQTALAQGRQLEINYPDIPMADTIPERIDTPIPEYMQYLYYFALFAAGAIALVVIVIAGLQYMASTGNPGKMQDSKERIISALLGLLILVGSYGILHAINEDLITFNLPAIRPIISNLPIGVLLCKDGSAPVKEAWDEQTQYYKTPADQIETLRSIKKSLDGHLKIITEKCYVLQKSENIIPEFDNKTNFVWFIPEKIYDNNFLVDATEFGVILYDETDFQGKSQPIFEHLINPAGKIEPYEIQIAGGETTSSAIPFKLIYAPDPGWNVTLYEEDNYNLGYDPEDKKTIPDKAPPGYSLYDWFCTDGSGLIGGASCINSIGAWPFSPKSMKVEGNLLVILIKGPNSQSFFGQKVPDLESYESIIEWVNCEDYKSNNTKTGTVVVPGFGGVAVEKCAKAASTGIAIIAAEPI